MDSEENMMDVFAERARNVPRSFLREILKTAQRPGMISFAGGLPNKDLFPVEAIRQACSKVFDIYGGMPLQYSTSEGLDELRQAIADRYKKKGVQNVSAENILITCGSQQALDLLGKVLIDEGDRVVLEEPSYLGAIQAFTFYRPKFATVPLYDDGLDIEKLRDAFSERVKLMYVIPNFQNPTGVCYSDENRRAVADVIRGTRTFLIEDDPYGELRFMGSHRVSFMNLIPENTILLGTFSKTVVPGFRLGWVVLPPALISRVVVAKQASDLHTNAFSQQVICQYLKDNDSDAHIAKIVARYSAQRDSMVRAIAQYFPSSVTHTKPEGGMFLWARLPSEVSALDLSDVAIEKGVCIVPGHPFYIGKDHVSTIRLSFSCVDDPVIQDGIQRLGKAIEGLCAKAGR
jgi:2-aminoadipate transaminase